MYEANPEFWPAQVLQAKTTSSRNYTKYFLQCFAMGIVWIFWHLWFNFNCRISFSYRQLI